jgi:hypothetical protein
MVANPSEALMLGIFWRYKDLNFSISFLVFTTSYPRLHILPSSLITVVSECPLFSLPLLVPLLAGQSLHQVLYYLSRTILAIVFVFSS